ncbi:unnamed protein product, partial [Staurois parvus]
MGPPIYRLLMLLPGPESVMGPCTASHCCCLHRATLCHVPLSGLLTLLLWSRVCHGSLYGLPLLLSPSPHSAMCHFQV